MAAYKIGSNTSIVIRRYRIKKQSIDYQILDGPITDNNARYDTRARNDRVIWKSTLFDSSIVLQSLQELRWK